MYIRVRVKTGAKKEVVNKIEEGLFEVSVKEEAQRNLANTRIREIVAEISNVPIWKVKMISGHKYSSKIFEVEDK